MNLEFYKKIEAKDVNNNNIFVWKFMDENGDIWRTQTSISGSELDAKQIILQSHS